MKAQHAQMSSIEPAEIMPPVKRTWEPPTIEDLRFGETRNGGGPPPGDGMAAYT